jgi:hypothetical protein
MRMSWPLCVLLGTLAWGQAAPSASAPAQPAPGPAQTAPKGTMPPAAPDTSASVPDDAAVITIFGVCPPQQKSASAKPAAKSTTQAKTAANKTPADDCKTIITKAEFERISRAVAPSPNAPLNPQMKRQLATVLPRIMALSDAARKQGLDKTPEFAERMKFARMQLLGNELQRKLQTEAANIPEADVEKYYKENPQSYEQYNLERIFVPRTKQIDNDVNAEDDKEEKLTDEQKKAKEAAEKAKADEAEQAMTKLVEDLRAKAAAGEDFAKLQKQAYEEAGMKIESPNVSLGSVRRTSLPPGHVSVLDLKPGEVSPVISDAAGHYIYKLVSKSQLPLDQVKTEIHNKLQNDRQRERMEQLNSSFKSEPNEAYFGPSSATMAPAHMAHPRPGMPPGPQTSQPAPQPAQPPAAKQD